MTDTTTTRLTGTLIRIRDEGYGFIHVDRGVEHYVNVSSMRNREDWQRGKIVTFIPGVGRPGKSPPAYDVVAIASDS